MKIKTTGTGIFTEKNTHCGICQGLVSSNKTRDSSSELHPSFLGLLIHFHSKKNWVENNPIYKKVA